MTMPSNPLDYNCTAFRVDANGKVIGVKLGITLVSGAKYGLYSVRLKDEYESGNTTVANCSVLDKNGINTGIQCNLSWPGPGPTFANTLLPGNPNNQHVIINGYNANEKMGPLAIHVGSKDAPISDVVFGLGLPFNRHVSFDVVFKEKGGVVEPPTDTTLKRRMDDFEIWALEMSRVNPGWPQFKRTRELSDLEMLEEFYGNAPDGSPSNR